MPERVTMTYEQAADLVPELTRYRGIPARLDNISEMVQRAVEVFALWEQVGREMGGYRLVGVVTDGYCLVYEKEEH